MSGSRPDPVEVLSRARAELARRRDLQLDDPAPASLWLLGGRPIPDGWLERLVVQLRALGSRP